MFRFNNQGDWLSGQPSNNKLDVSNGRLDIEYKVKDNADNESDHKLAQFEIIRSGNG